MKRLWLAGALLLLTAGLCIAARWYQYHQTTVLLGQLDEMIAYYEDGDWERCAQSAQAFAEEYEKRTQLFSCFLGHTDLLGSSETALLLPSVTRVRDDAEFSLESARCRAQLQRLRDIDSPVLPNIF